MAHLKMGDAGDDGWHFVATKPSADYFQPAAVAHYRKQIREWSSTGHWSGVGKHIKSTEIKTKVKVNERLGRGAAGWVDRITFRDVTMARKHIQGHRRMPVEKLREEANIMEKLAHKHIVELVGTYTYGHDLCILTYPAAACDLHGFICDIEDLRSGASPDLKDATKRLEALGFKGIISNNEQLESNWSEKPFEYLTSILGCVTEAVEFLHSKKIRHQDLKPRNILLSPQQVYLADFGISRDLKDATHSLTEGYAGGTPLYLAPEVAHNEKHNMSPADVYSLGCVFLTVASVLFGADHGQYETVMKDQAKRASNLENYFKELRALVAKTARLNENSPTFIPEHFIELIESMLAHDAAKRPKACQVNSALCEIGGTGQIFHGDCCKKDTTAVCQNLYARMASIKNEKADQANRMQWLINQHEQDKQQIEKLTNTLETYQLRIKHERNHAVEQYEKLLERRSKELEAERNKLKAAEAELAQLKAQRRVPRNNNRPPVQRNGPNINRNGRPEDILPRRRPSMVPVPSFPSTPLRPSTPTRPQLFREPSVEVDELINSIDSSFSKSSGVLSSGSVNSERTVRSPTPESPTLQKEPVSPILMNQTLHEGSADAKPVVKTWAEMMRKQPTIVVTEVKPPLRSGLRRGLTAL